MPHLDCHVYRLTGVAHAYQASVDLIDEVRNGQSPAGQVDDVPGGTLAEVHTGQVDEVPGCQNANVQLAGGVHVDHRDENPACQLGEVPVDSVCLILADQLVHTDHLVWVLDGRTGDAFAVQGIGIGLPGIVQ